MRTFNSEGFRNDYQNDYPNYTAEQDHPWFYQSDTHSEADRDAEREAQQQQDQQHEEEQQQQMTDSWCGGFSHFGQSAATATIQKDGFALISAKNNLTGQQFLGTQPVVDGFNS